MYGKYVVASDSTPIYYERYSNNTDRSPGCGEGYRALPGKLLLVTE